MIFPEACEETLALLQARRQPPVTLLYTMLSNEIEKLPGEAILVLDDYHTIHSMEVHNLLVEWTRHWPKPLHLVLISRISPPIPLAGLRAKRVVIEIRTRDLRFTPDETVNYLTHEQFSPVIQNAITLLEERFEGWPAGLHLAALSLRNAGSQESVLTALSGENPDITAYLVNEVLSSQMPAIQTFLLKTSILNRFCASLCESVVGEIDPAWNAYSCLDWIERSEMFVITLDNRREWFRYHHFFQELLQQRLSADLGQEQVNKLHHLASAWFEKQGLLDEALYHALAAGDIELAASQMYSGLRDVLNREDRVTLDRWLHLLPEELIQERSKLLMIKVYSLQFQWRLELQEKVLQQVEKLLASEENASWTAEDLQKLRGLILLPRAQQAFFSNQDALAIDLCRQVLELLDRSWIFVRGGAMIYLALSMQASGQEAAAERMLLEEYESYEDKTNIYGLFLLQSLSFIYLNTGQLRQARQIAQVLVQGATRSGLALMRYWGEWFLGMVCFHLNDLEGAEQHFSLIFENPYVAQISPFRDSVAGLALIHQIRGESSEAWRKVEWISKFDLELSGREDPRTTLPACQDNAHARGPGKRQRLGRYVQRPAA